MIKIFISHKNEDSLIARNIASELKVINIPYYFDVLDVEIIESGKELTDHIKKNLNDCTDIIVVMSSITKYSQWVPFEIGMAAQNDMPTATFLQENVVVPDFLEYWPRLKQPSDIKKYVSVRKEIQEEYSSKYFLESSKPHISQIAKFYDVLKQRL